MRAGIRLPRIEESPTAKDFLVMCRPGRPLTTTTWGVVAGVALAGLAAVPAGAVPAARPAAKTPAALQWPTFKCLKQ